MTRRMLIASMWCSCTSDAKYVPLNSVSLEWLFNNASTLLWADRLLVTRQDFELLHKQPYFDDEIDQECARYLFDTLEREGIIEVFDPGRYLNDITLESIHAQVDLDEQTWGVDPGPPDDKGRVPHDTIQLSGQTYCPPLIAGVYGSLTMARFLDCSCVFDRRERSFLENRFAALPEYAEVHSAGRSVFSGLYRVFLPSVIPERDFNLFCNPKRGALCANLAECQSNAKANLGRLIEYVLVAREKPELVRLAARLDDLEQQIGPDEVELRRALLRDVRREQRNLRMVYPAVRTWTRLTQMVSAPAALYGAEMGQPLIWMPAAGVAALAEALHLGADVIESRHSWLTLIADSIESAGG